MKQGAERDGQDYQETYQQGKRSVHGGIVIQSNSPASGIQSSYMKKVKDSHPSHTRPRIVEVTVIAKKDKVLKEQQNEKFDSRHNARGGGGEFKHWTEGVFG